MLDLKVSLVIMLIVAYEFAFCCLFILEMSPTVLFLASNHLICPSVR